MAPLPPTIPTSFVPRQQSSVAPVPRRKKSGNNIFMLLGMIALIGSILAAAGMFGYEFYLKSDRERKQASLAQAQQAINLPAVEEFIRLKNRFATAESLLEKRVYFSSFFDVLEEKTLKTVTFNSLRVSVSDTRSAEIQMTGRATTFNALAAQSALFATERRIRRAIFSDISTDEGGGVRFSLTATLEPQILTGTDVVVESTPPTTQEAFQPEAVQQAPEPVVPTTTPVTAEQQPVPQPAVVPTTAPTGTTSPASL